MFNISNLGLAFKAGKVVFGTEMSIKAIQTKKCVLVFIANDASVNTIKKINDKANFYQIETNYNFNSKTLSNAIGKANIKVLCIIDEGFKKMFT